MKKLPDDEKAKLQAKIEQARAERIQLITESLSDSPVSSDAENMPSERAIGDRGAKQMRIQKTQAMSVIEWVLRCVCALLILVLRGILYGVVQEYLYLLLGGVFFILFVSVIVVDALKSLKNPDYEWTRSDTKSLIWQILLCVGLGVCAIFAILELFSDLNDDWEGIVVGKWAHETGRTARKGPRYYVAVGYEGMRHRRRVMQYIWESVEVGDKLIKKKGSFKLRVVHTHRKQAHNL